MLMGGNGRVRLLLCDSGTAILVHQVLYFWCQVYVVILCPVSGTTGVTA